MKAIKLFYWKNVFSKISGTESTSLKRVILWILLFSFIFKKFATYLSAGIISKDKTLEKASFPSFSFPQ